MQNVQYAQKTSPGAFASQIGWINFGPNFSLISSQNPVTVSNYIPGGYIISFQLSLVSTIDPVTTPMPAFIGMTSPRWPVVPFGNVAYQGIQGYPLLSQTSNPPVGSTLSSTISINNIRVTDRNGNKVSDYTIFVADAETTNKYINGNTELWQITTDGGVWKMVYHMPSFNNTLTGPIVTGVGTQQVLETGTQTEIPDTDSYIYSTASPNNLSVYLKVFDGNQAIALGIIVNSQSQNLLLSKCCCVRINYLPSTTQQTYISPVTIRTLTYNGQKYRISDTPTIITGKLATYSVTSTSIIATPLATSGTTISRLLLNNLDVLQISYRDRYHACCNQHSCIVFASSISNSNLR